MSPLPDVIAGIFVGGNSRRMGTSKGLLLAPDGTGRTLVERLASEVECAAPAATVVLVGRRPEYAHLGRPFIEDELPKSGPLGGVVGLLAEAERRGFSQVLCVACDHPFLSADLIRRLLVEHPDASICCPHVDDRYQPLVARYHVSVLADFRRALREGRRSLQPLLSEHAAALLELDAQECELLRDWDTPTDLPAEG